MVALRPIAKKLGLVDHPGGRKSHVGEVPVIGGVAMFVGMYTGMEIIPIPSVVFINVFIASALLVIVGLFDDLWRRNLAPVDVRAVRTLQVYNDEFAIFYDNS